MRKAGERAEGILQRGDKSDIKRRIDFWHYAGRTASNWQGDPYFVVKGRSRKLRELESKDARRE